MSLKKANTKIIRDAFYSPETGFVGVDKLYAILKPQGIKRAEIKEWMQSQEVVQRNRKNTQPKNSFVPRFPLQQFQIDLIYIDNPVLNQAKYGLSCIDSFSKRADVELMKKRTQGETIDAMIAIFERMGTPQSIYSDEGSEFDNANFRKFCKDLDIDLIFTFTHATIVERFNRTIKEKISLYLQSSNSKTITNVLPKLIKNYNNTIHGTIGLKPNEVNRETQHIAQINLINQATLRKYQAIPIGTQVRVELKPKSFRKGYEPKFSQKVHKVTSKDEHYYYLDNDDTDRGYFRSNLQIVKALAEEQGIEADLENTREGQLKKKTRKVGNYFIPESNASERKRTSARERKPEFFLEDSTYGKIRY